MVKCQNSICVDCKRGRLEDGDSCPGGGEAAAPSWRMVISEERVARETRLISGLTDLSTELQIYSLVFTTNYRLQNMNVNLNRLERGCVATRVERGRVVAIHPWRLL